MLAGFLFMGKCNYLILQVFVARGKPTAHPRKQREAVPGFGCAAIGRRSDAIRGCLEMLAELAFSLPRATVQLPEFVRFS